MTGTDFKADNLFDLACFVRTARPSKKRRGKSRVLSSSAAAPEKAAPEHIPNTSEKDAEHIMGLTPSVHFSFTLHTSRTSTSPPSGGPAPDSSHTNAHLHITYPKIVCHSNFHEQDFALIRTPLYLDEFLNSCNGVVDFRMATEDFWKVL